MKRRYILGGYWGIRAESVEQCADRLLKFFSDMSKRDELLSTWYRKGRTPAKALEKRVNVTDREQLLQELNRGRNRRDFGHEVIEELGFSVNLWNGRKADEAIGLRVTCGCFSEFVSNVVVINLPQALGSLGHSDQMIPILAAMASAWDPEWAGVMSSEARSARNGFGKGPFVDWIVYIPQIVNSVPLPSIVTQVPGCGSIIAVRPTPPENDPETLSRIHNIEQIIRATNRRSSE